MDELFACTNSCALARFYTPTTAHTLSACFANFMREELSLSWPRINPLSLCIVCRQRLFINYPAISEIVVSLKRRKKKKSVAHYSFTLPLSPWDLWIALGWSISIIIGKLFWKIRLGTHSYFFCEFQSCESLFFIRIDIEYTFYYIIIHFSKNKVRLD